MCKVLAEKNCLNWFPNENDYELVFCLVDGLFIELGHNIPKYNNMLLADYLREMNLVVSDYCEFMRVVAPDYFLEYRVIGNRVRVDYKKRD